MQPGNNTKPRVAPFGKRPNGCGPCGSPRRPRKRRVKFPPSRVPGDPSKLRFPSPVPTAAAKRRPRLLSGDSIDRQVLVLLIVLDRRFGGRAENTVLDQNGMTAALVQHELKVFHHRRAAVRHGARLQHRKTNSHLGISHRTLPEMHRMVQGDHAECLFVTRRSLSCLSRQVLRPGSHSAGGTRKDLLRRGDLNTYKEKPRRRRGERLSHHQSGMNVS